MAFTAGNDTNILQSTDIAEVGAGAGNDRYVLDSSMLTAGQKIRINDAQGINTLQLVGGLEIVSSKVTASAIQLTLNNGSVITVLGANTFNFQTGGNPINGSGGVVQSFSEFVTQGLGLAAVPTGTQVADVTTTVTVGQNGGTSVTPPAATYALTGAASADEGSTATFALSTTNVAAGTQVAYTLSGIEAADLASGSLTGMATVGADGKAAITVALAADATTEGAENLVVTLDGKNISATTAVNDTSTTPVAVFSLTSSAASVDEGSEVTFTVTSSAAVTADTVVNYTLTGVSAADVTGGLLTGSVTILAGQTSATKTVGLVADVTTEGAETLTMTLDGTTVSQAVTVNDTSAAPSFSLTASASSLVAEGKDITFTVTPSAASATDVTLYVQISGATVGAITAQASADDFSAVFLPVTIPAGSTTPITVSTTVSADTTTEGPEGFQAKLLDSTFNVVTGVAAITGTITEGASSGKTYTLTTTQTTYTGTSGDDSFNGAFAKNGATADGSTVQPGYIIQGGDGVDTFNLTVSGTATQNNTLSAVQTSGVERVLVSNFQTDDAQDMTVDATLFSGLTTVGVSSSAASGDTIFTGLNSIVAAEMKNGAGDLTLTYGATAVAGTADTQKLAVSNTTGGTFTANGAETVEVTTATANAKLTAVASDALKSLKVSGDKNLEITSALNFASNGTATAPGAVVDASALTGGLTITTTANEVASITGGSGNDVFKLASLTKDDKVNGGNGTDTIELSVGNATIDATATSGELIGVSNVEVINIASTHDAATLDLDNTTGVTNVVAAANVKTITVATGGANDDADAAIAFTLNGTAYTTATIDFAGNAAADILQAAQAIKTKINTISGFTATDNGTDTVTVTATTGEAVEIALTNGTTTYTVNAYNDVTFNNITTQAVDIYSADGVAANLKDASGTTDTLSVNLKTVAADKGFDKTVGSITTGNVETINLNVSGMTKDVVTTVTTLSAAGTKTLNVSGDSALTIGTLTAGDMTALDGSTATGKLDITFSATKDQSIKTGSADDTIRLAGTLNNKDSIDGGAGNDVVTATVTSLTATTGALNIANVERVNLTNAGSATLNAAGITGTTEIAIVEHANAVSTTITNLSTTASLGLGHNGVATAATVLGTVVASLADETGTADSLTVNLNDTTDGDTNTVTLKTTGIETVNLAYSNTAAALASYTVTATDLKASTINVTGSAADVDNRVTLGTVNAATTKVDASGFTGALYASAATNTATTFSAKGGYAHSIVGGSLADTITLTGDAGAINYTVTGGTGNDVLNATLNALDTNFTNVSAVETLNLTIKSSTSAGFDNNGKDGGLNAATTVNILGGNSLSKFVMTGATIDAASAMKVDASTFAGTVELNLASDAFDSNLEIIGGASTADKVTTIIAAADATNKIKSMTGIETLVVTSTNNDTDAVIDLSNVTGLVTVDAQFTNNANADQIKAIGVADGVKFKVTSTETADNLVIELTNKTATTNAVNVEITTIEAAADVLNLDIAEVETLNFDLKNANAVSLNLDGITASGTAKTALTFTGANSATISGSTSALGNINASEMSGNLTVSSRTNTSAISITGGSGDDTFIMAAAADSINAGAGSDTLTLSFNAVMGAIQVDLSSTVDQVTSFNGSSNAAVQVGFEHVNLSSYAGFGADITAHSSGSTITGTSSNDQITLGAGVDTIKYTVADTGVSGSDTIAGFKPGASADKIDLTAAVNTTFQAINGTAADLTGAMPADSFLNNADNVTVASASGATVAKNVIIEVSSAVTTLTTMTVAGFRALFGVGGGKALTFGANDDFSGLVIAYNGTGTTADAAVFYVNTATVSDTAGTIGAGDTVTLVGTLSGVGSNALTADNFV